MTLTKAILFGNSKAVEMVRSIAATPALISLIPPFYIPLELESYSKDGQAEVAENPVIMTGSDKKKMVTDNVAPGSWSWDMTGYIPGLPPVELTNLYTPFVQLNTDLLTRAFEKGQLLTFKDRDCRFYRSEVVIESISIGMDAEVKNKTPVTLRLKRITTVNMLMADLSDVEQAATISAGAAGGKTLDVGSVNANKTTSQELGIIEKLSGKKYSPKIREM